MVTLLGFFFILGNVALLEVYDPSLLGQVGFLQSRAIHGYKLTDFVCLIDTRLGIL